MTTIARKIQFETSSQMLDAITFLSAAQKDILDLFNQYGKFQTNKKAVAKQICDALAIHIQLEEEIFHPALKKAVKENGAVSAVIMEHSILKYLMAEIESLDEDSTVYDIKINVLGGHVKDYFMGKQIRLFPKVVTSKKLDLWVMGSELAWRKQELENSHKFSSSNRTYAG